MISSGCLVCPGTLPIKSWRVQLCNPNEGHCSRWTGGHTTGASKMIQHLQRDGTCGSTHPTAKFRGFTTWSIPASTKKLPLPLLPLDISCQTNDAGTCNIMQHRQQLPNISNCQSKCHPWRNDTMPCNICVSIYIYIHLFIYLCVCMRIYIYMCVCVCACVLHHTISYTFITTLIASLWCLSTLQPSPKLPMCRAVSWVALRRHSWLTTVACS